MPDGTYRTTVGRLIWRTGLAVVLALQLLAVLALGKRVYMVQEALVGMLVIAISVAATLLLLVAFVLFQDGARRAALWMKSGISRFAKLNHRRISPADTILPPPLHR